MKNGRHCTIACHQPSNISTVKIEIPRSKVQIEN